jgi:DedD protein
MDPRTDSRSAARGLTVRQLTFIFVAAVGVCAIFFTLGFLVGTNERHVNANSPVTERVPPPGEIPPPVEGPADLGNSPGPGAASADSGSQVQEQNLSPASAAPEAASSSSSSAANSSAPSSPASPPGQKESSAASPVASKPSSGHSHGLIVQVAALHSAKEAESMVATLRSQGYPAFMVTPEQAADGDDVYRVQVGPYMARQEAASAKAKLVREGFNPFIK